MCSAIFSGPMPVPHTTTICPGAIAVPYDAAFVTAAIDGTPAPSSTATSKSPLTGMFGDGQAENALSLALNVIYKF